MSDDRTRGSTEDQQSPPRRQRARTSDNVYFHQLSHMAAFDQVREMVNVGSPRVALSSVHADHSYNVATDVPAFDENLDPPPASSRMIATLRDTVVSQDLIDSKTECSVCLEEFLPLDIVNVLKKCGHASHTQCLRKWLELRGTCPACRYPLYERPAATARSHRQAPNRHQGRPAPLYNGNISAEGDGEPQALGSMIFLMFLFILFIIWFFCLSCRTFLPYDPAYGTPLEGSFEEDD